MLSVTSVSQRLLITLAIFNKITVTASVANQPRSEKALSTLPSNSERGVCSNVKKCLIIKLLCVSNFIVDNNKQKQTTKKPTLKTKLS